MKVIYIVIVIVMLLFFFYDVAKSTEEYELKPVNVSIVLSDNYSEGFKKLCFIINDTEYYLYYAVFNGTAIPQQVGGGRIINCTSNEKKLDIIDSQTFSIYWQIADIKITIKKESE